MKKDFKLLFIFGIVLSSCTNIRSSMKKGRNIQEETVEITEYSEISGNDILLTSTLSFNAVKQKNGNKSLGANFKYHSIESGEFLLDYSLPLFFTQPMPEDFNFSERKIMKHELTFNYSLPLFSKELSKKRPISALDELDNSYYIFIKTKSYQKYNLRLGFTQDYNRIYTDNYSIQLDQENPDLQISGHPVDEVNQWNSIVNIGASFQNCLNTNLKAVDEVGRKFTGRSSEITTIYFNLGVLVNSFVDENEHNYYGTINGISIDSVGFVSPKDYLKRQPIGFSIGYEHASNYLIKPKTLMSYCVEFGTLPGYYSNLRTSLYAKLSVRLGFGFWK